jgi:hypothetical protein
MLKTNRSGVIDTIRNAPLQAAIVVGEENTTNGGSIKPFIVCSTQLGFAFE